VKWLRRKPVVVGLTILVVLGSLVLGQQLLKNGETELPLHATLKGLTKIHLAVFSPDGKTLATAEADHTIKLWDAATGQERAVLNWKPVLQAAGGLDGTVHFSPDSATLATAGYWDNKIALKLWNVATGEERATLKGQSRIESVVFSPDGKTVAMGGLQDAITLWDATTGQKRATLKIKEILRVANGISFPSGPLDPQPAVILSPDGKTILTAGTDGTIQLWEAATGQERATLRQPVLDLVKAVFSPDGKNLATLAGEDRTVTLWDAATGKERATLLKLNKPGLILLRYVSLASSWRNHKLSGLWMPNS
jgi:WD40 repeat protein